MSSNNSIQNSFLRTTRDFPEDLHALSQEIDRTYVDVANAVNLRTIGIFPTKKPIMTGEGWFINAQRRQGLRQIYTFTAAGSIPHGINTANIYAFTKIYGTFTDGSIWYPLPYVNVVNANNQVSITVTSSNIVITAGAGAPPVITSGYVVLEWIANV